MAIATCGACQVGHELGSERTLDVIENFFLHGFHTQHPHDHFHREVFRQQCQNARRVVGLDL